MDSSFLSTSPCHSPKIAVNHRVQIQAARLPPSWSALNCLDRKLSQIIVYILLFKNLFHYLSPRNIHISLHQLFCSNQIDEIIIYKSYMMIKSSSKSPNPGSNWCRWAGLAKARGHQKLEQTHSRRTGCLNVAQYSVVPKLHPSSDTTTNIHQPSSFSWRKEGRQRWKQHQKSSRGIRS